MPGLFNRQKMTSMIPFGTKAETLKNLSSVITKAKILPQITFPVVQHKSDPKKILLQIDEQNWMNSPLIIRSSAKREDSAKESFAGYFSSVLNVKGLSAILTGIDEVILSFKGYRDEDQILIQPMLQDILFS